ncbi:RyR domain-containing protein [Sagittula sp. S175]|uniref:RyR domain-containing protein n=1 Tax=Sagittula sp. S175 TaxID=3415129 RepID=UPI003C7B5753
MSLRDRDRRFFVSLTQVCLLVTAALGFAGYLLLAPFDTAQGPGHVALLVSDAAYSTARLFILEGPEDLATQGSTLAVWMVGVARLLAPLALAGYAVTLSERLWRPIVTAIQARQLKDHTVIVGWDTYAIELARDLRAEGAPMAIMLPPGEDAARVRRLLGRGTIVMTGDIYERRSWQNIRMMAARAIVVFASDLELLRIVETFRGFEPTRLDRDIDPGTPTRVFLRVTSRRLKRQLIVRQGLFASSRRFRFEPFNVEELAARTFFHERHLFLDAIRAGHERLHWVFLGWSDSLSALSEQLVKVSPVPGLLPPRLTVFSREPDRTNAQIGDLLGPVRDYIDWTVCDWRPGATLPPMEQLRTLSESTPLTGVFLASGDSGDLTRSLTLESAMDQGRVTRAPIWIERAHETEVAETLLRAGVESAPRRPVLTATMLLGSLDRAARAFHEAYTAYAKQSAPWEDLDETFRNANRRAADHSKTKLEALGLSGKLNDGPRAGDLEALVRDNLEPLARAEHDSWSIDRLMGGWRYGPDRDDTARLHPSLVPYDDLDGYQKDLDRWQVQQLPNVVAASGP